MKHKFLLIAGAVCFFCLVSCGKRCSCHSGGFTAETDELGNIHISGTLITYDRTIYHGVCSDYSTETDTCYEIPD